MRAVVFAYQEIGYVCLEELLMFGVQVSSLFTHEDDPDEELWFRRPVSLALKHDIPVFKPDTLKEDKWAGVIRKQEPDYIFSFYYRHMIPKKILDISRVASLNLHGSLLPKYRGRAPVNWVLVNGENETGVTLHEMVEKPDAGDIVAQKKVDIQFEDDVRSLYINLTQAARLLMKEILPGLEEGSFRKMPQSGESSYFGGRRPEDGLISWEKDALSIYNLTRAVTHPYPGAYTFVDGKKLFIWSAYPEDEFHNEPPGTVISTRPLKIATGRGSILILRGQVEGGPEMEGVELSAVYNLKDKILGGTI